MKALVAQGMEEGAFGISTGLVYAPGCYAETHEIIELASVVAEYGGIYVTHMRNEGNHLYDALMEAIEIGKCAGLPVQISHHKAAGRLNWGKVKVSLKIMEDARRNGVDITCDVYPYTAGCTWCLSPMLPNWILEGGVEAMIERLKNPEVREKIRRRVREGVGVSPLLELGEWDSIVIGAVKTEKNRRFEGKTVAEIAEMRGVDPLDCIFDLIVEEEDEMLLLHHERGGRPLRDQTSSLDDRVGRRSPKEERPSPPEVLRNLPKGHPQIRQRDPNPHTGGGHPKDDLRAGSEARPERPRTDKGGLLGGHNGLQPQNDPGRSDLRGPVQIPCGNRVRPR